MTKDWNAEWDMEQSEVDDMIASYEATRDCEHDWTPLDDAHESRHLFGARGAEECTKCGGVQITVSEREFEALKGMLDAGKI